MIKKSKKFEKRSKKRYKKTIKEQPVFIDNEPEYSGNPINTIQKDLEEQDNEKKRQEVKMPGNFLNKNHD